MGAFEFILSLVKRVIKYTILFLSVATIITLVPNLPPYTTFSSIDIGNLQPQVGPLKINEAVNNVEMLYKDKLLGPESFQIYNGDLYTGVATGEILKISPGGHVTFVTKIGQPCNGLIDEHICGRPLGFQIDEKKNQLYVCDAYHGIWKVDLKNDKKTLLVSPRVEINGKAPKFFNSLALAKNGDLYWTDSSVDYHLKDGTMTLLSDPSGRLLQYNAARNESKVLLDKLWFSNGLVLSADEQFLIVAETYHFRLLKYYLSGPNKGKSEVFISGLPGAPDVVRVVPDGSGILVGLYTVADEQEPFIIKSLAKTPLVRQFLARTFRITEIGFEYLNSFFPNVIFEDIVYRIGHFQMLAGFASKSGLAYIDWNGKIISTYYNTDGSVKSISDGIVFKDKLMTGAPHGQNFIAAVPAPPELKKAFASVRSKDVPEVEKPAMKQEAKQSQQKPVEKVKVVQPTTSPKPAEKPSSPKHAETKPTPRPTMSKPVEKTTETITPKPSETKPTAKPVEVKAPKSAVPQPSVEPVTPKPAQKQAESIKPSAKPTGHKTVSKADSKESKQTTTPSPKTEKPNAEAKAKADKTPEAKKPAKENKPPRKVPEVVPIEEEIPSDTVKPTAETLKVIKKEGPAEIPNPNK